MPKRSSEHDSGGQDFVSTLLDDLQSRGILEQLRLECVADVKTKPTYLQLKQRMKDYVTKRMSTEEWTSDNTFREQVVECGVLALTVERIVDEVVSRKLQEQIRPLVVDLIKEQVDRKTFSKLQIYKSDAGKKGKRSSHNTSFEKTVKVVRTICRDTKRDYNKILEDGLVAHSLASVSFSKSTESEDNMSMSVGSTNISDLSSESESDDEGKSKPKAVNAKSDEVQMKELEPEFPVRSRRERKLNPKYSSSMYQTSMLCHIQNPPLVTSTPKKDRENGIALTNGTTSPTTSKTKLFRKRTKHEEHHFKEIVHNESENEQEKSSSYVRKEYVEESYETSKPIDKRKQGSYAVELPQKVDTVDVLANGSVRKSSRQRKINSRIFQDSLPPYTTKGLRTIIPVSENENDGSSKILEEKDAVNSVGQGTSTEISPPEHSTKRYKTSDLYKPHQHSSSSARTKRVIKVP